MKINGLSSDWIHFYKCTMVNNGLLVLIVRAKKAETKRITCNVFGVSMRWAYSNFTTSSEQSSLYPLELRIEIAICKVAVKV